MTSRNIYGKNELSHKFSMFAGGALVICEAVMNTLIVRPMCSVFARVTGRKAKTSSNFLDDIMPLSNE